MRKDMHHGRSALLLGDRDGEGVQDIVPPRACRYARNILLLQPTVCWRLGVNVAANGVRILTLGHGRQRKRKRPSVRTC